MAASPESISQIPLDSPLGRGKSLPAGPDPGQPPPLAGKVKAKATRPPKPNAPGFLAARAIRHSYSLRGRARHKTGGTWQNLPAKGKRERPRGAYVDDPPMEITADMRRAALNRKEIGATALALLADYLRRRSFWQAIEDGYPVEFAGQTHLGGCTKRRSEQIRTELELDGGPRRWFLRRVVSGIGCRKIPHGRSTAPSPLATLFFEACAGGRQELDRLRTKSFGRRTAGGEGDGATTVEEATSGLTVIEREIVEYFVCRHL